MSPSAAGIEPENWLSPSSSQSSLRVPKSGIEPASAFPLMLRPDSLGIPSSCVGKAPEKLLPLSQTHLRLVMPLMSLGTLVSWLPSSSRRVSLVRPVSSSGKAPVSSLSPRSRSRRLARLPNSVGIVPERSLSDRSSATRSERSPSSVGIVPVRSFPSRSRRWRFVRSPSTVGIVPVRSLRPRLRYSSPVRLPSSVGIGPLKLPSSRSSVSSLARLPSVVGIGPRMRLLFDRSSTLRLSKLPNVSGIPLRPLLDRSRRRRWTRLSSKGVGVYFRLFPGSSSPTIRSSSSITTPFHSSTGLELSQLPCSSQMGPAVEL